MGSPVVHVEVTGKDSSRLQGFYHEAFDWKIAMSMPAGNGGDYTIMQPGEDGGVVCGIGMAPEGRSGHVTFYVSVADAEEALRKVESLGGKRVMGPDRVPDGPLIGLFEDPEGHVIGVVQTEG